jgi:hypothetical protein
MWQAQDYPECDRALVVFQNHPAARPLLPGAGLAPNVTIANWDGLPFGCLGQLYTEMVRRVPGWLGGCIPDLVQFWDDDDIYFADHVSAGVDGYKRGGLRAYRPTYSMYAEGDRNMGIVSNYLEPSWTVKWDVVAIDAGFHIGHKVAGHHLKWVGHLMANKLVYSDDNGPITFVCQWQNGAYKTSGNPSHPDNVDNYRAASLDFGDDVLTPWDRDKVEEVYDLFCEAKK